MTIARIAEVDLHDPSTPLLVSLMQPMTTDPSAPGMDGITWYKTFNGEEINGEKVWNKDFHDDDQI